MAPMITITIQCVMLALICSSVSGNHQQSQYVQCYKLTNRQEAVSALINDPPIVCGTDGTECNVVSGSCSITSVRKIYIKKAYSVLSVSFPQLRVVGTVLVYATSALSLRFDSLLYADHLTVIDNQNLTSVVFPSLVMLHHSFIIERCNRVEDIRFPSLQIAGKVTITLMPRLTRIDAPILQTVKGYLQVTRNPILSSIDLLKLDRISGALIVKTNFEMVSMSFPSLSVVGNIFVRGNKLLASALFPEVAETGRLHVGQNALEKLQFPSILPDWDQHHEAQPDGDLLDLEPRVPM